jgi:hypothetical protein
MRNEKEIEVEYRKHEMCGDVKKFAVINQMSIEDVAQWFWVDGAQWMQKDLFESASEGFEEWFGFNTQLSIEEALPVWQAAKLSDQKIIQEKDEEIAKLKNWNDLNTNWKEQFENVCNERDLIFKEKDNEIKRLRELCETYERDLGISEE